MTGKVFQRLKVNININWNRVNAKAAELLWRHWPSRRTEGKQCGHPKWMYGSIHFAMRVRRPSDIDEVLVRQIMRLSHRLAMLQPPAAPKQSPFNGYCLSASTSLCAQCKRDHSFAIALFCWIVRVSKPCLHCSLRQLSSFCSRIRIYLVTSSVFPIESTRVIAKTRHKESKNGIAKQLYLFFNDFNIARQQSRRPFQNVYRNLCTIRNDCFESNKTRNLNKLLSFERNKTT